MINGLTYIKEFIGTRQEQSLVKQIDESEWDSKSLKRRIQHYGWRYNYKNRSVTQEDYLGLLPRWASSLTQQLYDQKHVNYLCDQCIVNEYIPPQGIGLHTDCEPCFGNIIVSVSLLSPVVMNFKNISDDKYPEGQIFKILLEPRSALIMTGKARFFWQHELPHTKTYTWKNQEYERGRRISVTFRKVLDEFYQIDDPIVFTARSLGGEVSNVYKID